MLGVLAEDWLWEGVSSHPLCELFQSPIKEGGSQKHRAIPSKFSAHQPSAFAPNGSQCFSCLPHTPSLPQTFCKAAVISACNLARTTV